MSPRRQDSRPAVTHINLARGFRGGENQTLLLVRELATRGWRQQVIGRPGEPLLDRMADIEEVLLTPAGNVLTAALKVRAPLVHAHEARAGQAAWLAAKTRRRRYILTRRVMKAPSQSWLTERVYRNASAVTALSAAIARVLQARFPEGHFPVIPSALEATETDRDEAAAIRQQYGDGFLVGNVAALDVAKGHFELVASARVLLEKYPEMAFLCIGGGKDEVRIKAAAAGVDRLYFTGFVDKVPEYLAALDLFVFPSHHEGLGSVLLQAMAAEVPIVASATGGIPEIVIDGETGLLAPVGDADALTNAVERLYQDAELRRELAANAAGRLGEFAVERVVDRIEALYRDLGA